MRPIQPEQVYKKTANRLNLSEEYVKDAVEYYYAYNKARMFSISYVIFNFYGLGRFILRPLKFYSKQKNLIKLIEKFADRRDDRGIMIRTELIRRLEEFDNAKCHADELFQYNQKRMYKYLRDENKIESTLEK